MNKIECYLSDEFYEQIEGIRKKERYTKAEFNRRALEYFLDKVYGVRSSLVKEN